MGVSETSSSSHFCMPKLCPGIAKKQSYAWISVPLGIRKSTNWVRRGTTGASTSKSGSTIPTCSKQKALTGFEEAPVVPLRSGPECMIPTVEIRLPSKTTTRQIMGITRGRQSEIG